MILRVKSTDTVVGEGGSLPGSASRRRTRSVQSTHNGLRRWRACPAAAGLAGDADARDLRSAMPPVGLVVSTPPAGAEGTDANGLRRTADDTGHGCSVIPSLRTKQEQTSADAALNFDTGVENNVGFRGLFRPRRRTPSTNASECGSCCYVRGVVGIAPFFASPAYSLRRCAVTPEGQCRREVLFRSTVIFRHSKSTGPNARRGTTPPSACRTGTACPVAKPPLWRGAATDENGLRKVKHQPQVGLRFSS